MAKVTKEEFLGNGLTVETKQSTPPNRFTEATLIKKLETEGVGRPSTYATIVETVLSESRGYATLDGKSIVPTERGMQLAAFLDRAFPNIIKLDYTKEMEEDLDRIANGKLTKLQFLTEFYNNLEHTINNNVELKTNTENGEAPTCPKCGAPMVIRRSKFGKLFYGCSKYPKCNGIVNIN